MSRLINNEKNTIIEICVCSDKVASTNERYGVYVSLCSPELRIQSSDPLILNCYDYKYLRQFLINTTSDSFFLEGNSKTFADSNAVFELGIFASPEDEMYSIEFWVNVATISFGEKYGYDYGIRFATSKDNYLKFANELLCEL